MQLYLLRMCTEWSRVLRVYIVRSALSADLLRVYNSSITRAAHACSAVGRTARAQSAIMFVAHAYSPTAHVYSANARAAHVYNAIRMTTYG